VATVEQKPRNDRTDVPGTAGDEQFHRSAQAFLAIRAIGVRGITDLESPQP
jgi:hypothetical protein